MPELIARLKRGETLALISDHGTPMLADPGGHLVARAIAANLPVSAIPGASSLLAALAVSGLPLDHFRFVGFLPAKKELRRAALIKLRDERDTWVVFDTPYRLTVLLDDLLRVLGAERRIVVACNLTLPDENIVRGTTAQVVKHFQQQPFKGEFVIVVEGKVTAEARRTEENFKDNNVMLMTLGALRFGRLSRPTGTLSPVRPFGTFTPDLKALAGWLRACAITTVAMESTGVVLDPDL